MTSVNRSKINLLLQRWPPETVATTQWLAGNGVSQQLAHAYEKAGWLRHMGSGAYARFLDQVDWTGGLYTLQMLLKLDVHVGGKTALELRGLGHFIPAREGSLAYLFGAPAQKLPKWYSTYQWKRRIVYKMPNLFGSDKNLGVSPIPMGAGTYPVQVSTPERAVMELLHLTPNEQSFEGARLLMEGLNTLRPQLVQSLLENCRSIKVRRLFLYLAEKSGHAWLSRVDLKRVNLGKGKREIVKGGTLDLKYQITVPKALTNEEEGKGQ